MSKVAIVTGASRGIGAATAIALAEAGYAVGVNYLNSKEDAQNVIDQITQAGGKAMLAPANIANENDITRLFSDVEKKFGPVSVLVNNVGINGGISLVEEISRDKLEKVFNTNVFGTFICCREAIKHMRRIGFGNIINVTSEAAKFGGSQLAHYSASKAAINTLTIALAREVATANIRVNAVSPGVIDTHIHSESPPERLEILFKSLPMKRMGKSQEVASLISWLVSDAASYISGSIIPVTGAR